MQADEPGSSDETPRLVHVSTYLLLLMPVRLGFGLAGLLAASLVGQSGPAVLAFALGVLGSAVVLSADPRYSRDRLGDPLSLPAEPRLASRAQVVARGVFPSTVGVAVLAVVSLFFDATLAALLAGVLGGMAVAGLWSWLTLDSLERRSDFRLYVERGGAKRVFAGPR